MSFTCRIADQTVYLVDTPDFGNLTSDGRSVSFTAVESSATKPARLAAISLLNSRLQMGCDLVLLTTNATYPMSLRLLPGGKAEALFDESFELGSVTFYQVTAPCAPYATPANRVFLAAPFGDSLPSSADVVPHVTDAIYDVAHAYASAGRYMVYADIVKRGRIDLYGDCVAREVLVVECDWELLSVDSGGLTCEVSFLDSGGNVINTWGVVAATSVSANHARVFLRADAAAVGFRLTIYAHAATSSALGAVWNIEVGRKSRRDYRTVPTGPSSWATTVLPEGWAHNAQAGVTWDYGATAPGWFGVDAVAPAADGTLWEEDAHPVEADHIYGVTARSQVLAHSAGNFRILLVFYDAAGGWLSTTTLVDAATTRADTTDYATVAAPNTAATGCLFVVVTAGSTLTAKVTALDWGESIVESPGVVHLTATPGEIASQVECHGDVDVESDAHSVYLGVGPSDGSPYIWEAENLTWSAGAAVSAAAAPQLYASGVNSGWYRAGVTAATASIDTSRVRPGTYLLLARALTNNVSYAALLTCVENGGTATTSLTTPSWISLGQIQLPSRRTRLGIAATITVGIANANASGTTTVDRYMLVPVSFGGYAIYHDAVATDATSQFDIDEDGQILLDGIVDMADCIGGQLVAGCRDRLVVCSECAASTEPTHLVDLTLLATPRYSLWR